MRNWLILLELAYAILFLTIFYFSYRYFYLQRSLSNPVNFNIDEIRELNQSCNLFSNYEYIIFYNNFSNYTVCIYGQNGTFSNLTGNPIFEYLYSGRNDYNPFLIIIYR